jgi:hypothetical protein
VNWFKNYEAKEEDSDEYAPRQLTRMNNQGQRNIMGQRHYYVNSSL